MKFNVGDKVFVKLWDEMMEDKRVQEDHKGNLFEKDKPQYSFNKGMKRFCGSAALVKEITDKGEIYLFFDSFENVGYMFREWMLEPAEEKRTVFIVSGGDE